jgi:hypothetical protein
VAKLPDSTIVNIFTLQRRLADCLESTTAMEFSLFQQFGETAETAPELEELVNIRARLVSLYNRLHNIFLRVTQSQPIASEDLLNLLYRLPPVRFANDRTNRNFDRYQYCQPTGHST